MKRVLGSSSVTALKETASGKTRPLKHLHPMPHQFPEPGAAVIHAPQNIAQLLSVLDPDVVGLP